MAAFVRPVVRCVALLMVLGLAPGAGWAADDVGLTGTWYTPDGEGVFQVRTAGDAVWWVGKSASDDGKSWTNAFHGALKDKKLTGTWANVNLGPDADHGTAALELVEEDGKVVRLKGKVTAGGKESTFTLQRTNPKAK